MTVVNTSVVIGQIIENLTIYVLGNTYLTGLWFALIGFGLLSILKIEFSIGVVLLIPLTIGLMATGYITSVAGGVIIFIAAVVAGWNFFRMK